MSKTFIIMSGNPFEGYEFFGPFDNIDDAQDWGEGSREFEWYLVSVKSPLEAYEKDGFTWSTDAKKVMEKGWK